MRKGIIHRAKWVLPISRRPVEDGAVVISDGHIKDVGDFSSIKRTHLLPIRDHGEVAFLPGLVNVHTHLELCALRKLGKNKHRGNFPDWVKELLAYRSKLDSNNITESKLMGLQGMRKAGTAAFGDIANELGGFFSTGKSGIPFQFFWERIGFKTKKLQFPMETPLDVFPDKPPSSFNLAAHAVYSTSPELITAIKAWNSERGRRMSIHISEHGEEIQFLMTGEGPCKDLLQERNQWDDEWVPPACSPVEYLDRLGVLDKNTIGVHLVYVSKKDLEILKRREVSVAVCPRSNWYFNQKLPPLKMFIEADIPFGIGTDSLASNETLNLFDELAFLESRSSIAPSKLLQIATMGGAKVLDLHRQLGSLDLGKMALILEVPLQDTRKSEIFSEIISKGKSGEIKWVN